MALSAKPAISPGAVLRRLRWGREQLTVLLCLILLAGLAWLMLLQLADAMRMPEMAGMAMPARAWSLTDFALRLAMWLTMMVGMMLPSAMPMIMLFSQVMRRQPLRVAWFTLAYVVVWSSFSLLATVLQQLLEWGAWLSPMSMQSVPGLGAALLMLAGVYQWLPAKHACLEPCRVPLAFLLRYPMSSQRDAWRLGCAHGLYCLGCCWALMGLLFAVGVMNLMWVAALAGFVLLEKLLPGPWLSRLSGALLLGWGLALAFGLG